MHGALACSTLPGLLLWWMPKRLDPRVAAIAGRVHLVALTASLLGLGVLGIVERGGLVLMAIALLCTNLVYQLPWLQRLAFNGVLLFLGTASLMLAPGGDFLRNLIAASELMALVLICMIAGEMHFGDRVGRILAEHRMARMANSDALTGLANRRCLQEALRRELTAVERGRALTVILADIDHFKAVNDRYGHDVGDVVLQAVARTLSGGARLPDLVGRWGGEEFLLLCPDTPLDGGRQLAERLAALLRSNPVPVAGARTASFGVAQAQPGEPVEALFGRVDQALYAAKQAGRDRVVVSG
jgi:diguanylate cyclase (GGDEF)-like protein